MLTLFCPPQSSTACSSSTRTSSPRTSCSKTRPPTSSSPIHRGKSRRRSSRAPTSALSTSAVPRSSASTTPTSSQLVTTAHQKLSSVGFAALSHSIPSLNRPSSPRYRLVVSLRRLVNRVYLDRVLHRRSAFPNARERRAPRHDGTRLWSHAGPAPTEGVHGFSVSPLSTLSMSSREPKCLRRCQGHHSPSPRVVCPRAERQVVVDEANQAQLSGHQGRQRVIFDELSSHHVEAEHQVRQADATAQGTSLDRAAPAVRF